MLQEQKKADIKKAEDDANKSQTEQSMKRNIDDVLKKETQVMLSNPYLSSVSPWRLRSIGG